MSRYFGPKDSTGMSQADRKGWAKEEIIAAIDAMINDKIDGMPVSMDYEDKDALLLQRARIAKLLGMPEFKPEKNHE